MTPEASRAGGLRGDTPATLSLYRLAVHELGMAASVLDGGCGKGAGTELFTQSFARVIGVDHDPAAIAAARRRAARAEIRGGELASLVDVPAVDAVALIDVLGEAKSPGAVLSALRGVLRSRASGGAERPGTLFVAERAAHSPQFLAPPARRAFTASTLGRMLAIAGYDVRKWVTLDGSYVVCVAEPFFEPAWELLLRAHGEFLDGRADEACRFFQRAEREGQRDSVRLEAAIGLAHLALLRRDGDGVAGACLRARAIASRDARPDAVLARVALAVGDTEEARRLAELASSVDPADFESAYANAVVGAGRNKASVKENWLLASNLAPDSLELAGRLAAAAIEESDFALAIFALERVRAYGDDHGAALHIALAWALFSAGRRADALLEARVAEQLAPGDAAVGDSLQRCRATEV